jgi:hypothetical protein
MSTGTVTLAGGNNITLSQNGNAITISGANAAAGSQTLGISNIGNTSGTTGVISGSQLRFAFAGGNNVTLSQSLNGSSGTITISAANQTIQTQNMHNVTLGGNTAGVMAQISSGTLTLAGGNNITLSQNGNAITISGGAGGAGDGYNAAQFTNSTANSTMPILWAGNSNGSGNITLGLTGSTVTGSAPSGGAGNTTHATMWFPYNEAVNVVSQVGQASLGFVPVPTPTVGEELRIDRLVYPLYFTNASNSTGSLTASFWMGLYTKSDNSISLAHSLSSSATLGYAGNNSSASQRGIRLLTFGWTTTIPDNRYYVGVVSRTTTAGANASLSQVLVSQLNSNVSGMWNEVSNATVQWPMGIGYYSATTAGLPASVAFSQIRGTNSLAARPPSWHMRNGTA